MANTAQIKAVVRNTKTATTTNVTLDSRHIRFDMKKRDIELSTRGCELFKAAQKRLIRADKTGQKLLYSDCYIDLQTTSTELNAVLDERLIDKREFASKRMDNIRKQIADLQTQLQTWTQVFVKFHAGNCQQRQKPLFGRKEKALSFKLDIFKVTL
jgi:hypothetical protein